MSKSIERSDRTSRRLPSVFDTFSPGTPLSLDDLELAMSRDTERRALAALDRALARLAAPVLPTPHSLGPPSRQAEQPT